MAYLKKTGRLGSLCFRIDSIQETINKLQDELNKMESYKQKIKGLKMDKSKGDTATELMELNKAIETNISYRNDIMRAIIDYLTNMITTLRDEEAKLTSNIGKALGLIGGTENTSGD